MSEESRSAAANHQAPALAEPVTGNYFVSTYPPFFYWKKEEVAAVEPALEQTLATAPPWVFIVTSRSARSAVTTATTSLTRDAARRWNPISTPCSLS